MKRLNITLTDDNRLEVQASEPLTVDMVADLALSTILAVMNQTVESAPEDQQLEIKEYLFDTFNVAASNVLAQFAPDIDLRPDITEQAILDAELDIAFRSTPDESNDDELSDM